MQPNNVPKLRFPEFRDEWQEKTLEQVVNITSGQSPDGRTYNSVGDGLPLYQGKKDFGSMITTTSGVWTTEPVKTAEKLDVLLSVRAPVGDINYAGEKMAIGRGLTAIRPKNEFIVREFLFALLLRYHRKLKDLSSGSTFEAISASDIKKVKVCLPSIQEQQKIAEFLTTVDEKIELMRQKLELLKKYKKGAMQKIFSQQVRFKDDSGKGFPEWRHVNAGEVFKNISNKSHDGDLPILAITQQGIFHRNSLDRKIDSSESGIKNYKIIEPGDFVISLRSFQGGIEMSDTLGISSPAYTVMRPLNDEEVSSVFYKYFFKKESFISQLNGAVIGIREGKQISYEVFANLKIPLPTLKEQQKIADFLAAIDDKVELEEKKLEHVKLFKKSLLQQMFV